ncbi:MAG: CoA transferase [Jatrophihabitans sp.]|nr:MAG: CoA transferase [Jatrophihabitans sp.]
MTGPLARLVVIELGRYVAAPFAGRLLADWGANVIKVEAPEGDPMRWGPLGDRPAWSPQFASWNRGKRSVTLDLKTSDGRAALGALLDGADVLLHNLRPAALAGLGLAPGRLRADRPHLVVCGVSGFGDAGPHASRRTFDSVVSGISGLYSQLLDPASPRPTGPAFTDLLAGMFAAQAVLAALHARDRVGGQVIDIPMLAAAACAIDDAFTTYTEAGIELTPDARQARQQIFAATAADGRHLVVHLAGDESIWREFAAVVDRPQWLDDPRFRDYRSRLTHVDALAEQVRAVLRTRPRAEWLALLHVRDIPSAPINAIADAVVDADVGGAVLVDVPVPGEAPMRMTRPVGRFGGSPVSDPAGPPAPGEHTRSIVAGLDMAPEARAAVLTTWAGRRISR